MKKLSKSSAAALLTLALGVVPVIPAIAAAPPEKADVKVTTKHSVAVDGEVMEDGTLNVDGVIITFVEDENGVKKPWVPLPNGVEVEQSGTAEYSITVKN